MSDTTFQPGSTKAADPFHASQFPGGPVPNDGTSIDPGTPVTIFDESVKSRANAANTSNVSGLAVTAADYPNRPLLQFSGPLTLTTEQWDARVTGQSGGLTPHSVYYLDAAAAGKLTTTKPSNPNYITPVGFAHNANTMMIQIGTAVQASS
jgi:hypothetical protein